jgi:hypothetical protein
MDIIWVFIKYLSNYSWNQEIKIISRQVTLYYYYYYYYYYFCERQSSLNLNSKLHFHMQTVKCVFNGLSLRNQRAETCSLLKTVYYNFFSVIDLLFIYWRHKSTVGTANQQYKHYIAKNCKLSLYSIHIHDSKIFKIYNFEYIYRSWGSSVSTVTELRVWQTDSIPSRGRDFFSSPLCPDQLWGPPSLLPNGYHGLSLALQQPGHWTTSI